MSSLPSVPIVMLPLSLTHHPPWYYQVGDQILKVCGMPVGQSTHREVVAVILPLQRALRAGSHNAQRTLDQAWLRHSACSGVEET